MAGPTTIAGHDGGHDKYRPDILVAYLALQLARKLTDQ